MVIKYWKTSFRDIKSGVYKKIMPADIIIMKLGVDNMYDGFLELVKKYHDQHNLNLTTFEDADIKREEARFGTLPPSYLKFLKQCPTGSFFNEAFILYEGPLSFEDLSLEVRTVSEKGLIAFGDDLGGTILCFDTNHPNKNGEFPIVEYKYPDYRIQIADSFSEWIMGMIGMFV